MTKLNSENLCCHFHCSDPYLFLCFAPSKPQRDLAFKPHLCFTEAAAEQKAFRGCCDPGNEEIGINWDKNSTKKVFSL